MPLPAAPTGKQGLNGKKEIMDWGPAHKYTLLSGVEGFEAGWQAVMKKFKGKEIKNDNPRGGKQLKFLKEADVKWQRKIILLGDQKKDQEETMLRFRMVQTQKGMYYAQGKAKEIIEGSEDEQEEDEDDGKDDAAAPAAAAPAAAVPAQVEAPAAPPPRAGRPGRATGRAEGQDPAAKRPNRRQ